MDTRKRHSEVTRRRGRSKEKLRLQEALDDHGQARHLLEADLKVTTEQFHEYKRQAQQRETDYSTRVHASANKPQHLPKHGVSRSQD